MGEPVTWPYFDEGERPPTVYELAQDIIYDSLIYYVRHISEGGNSLDEKIEIGVSDQGSDTWEGIHGQSFNVIGMQGPGKALLRVTKHFISSYGEILIEGKVYYEYD